MLECRNGDKQKFSYQANCPANRQATTCAPICLLSVLHGGMIYIHSQKSFFFHAKASMKSPRIAENWPQTAASKTSKKASQNSSWPPVAGAIYNRACPLSTEKQSLHLYAQQGQIRYTTGMSATILNRQRPDGTAALMSWLDPPRRPVILDGVTQPLCATGTQVAANLPIYPPLAAALAIAVDDWLLGGRMGAPAIPPGIPPDVCRVVSARISSMAIPNGSRSFSKAITHREIHSGRVGKQRRNKVKKTKIVEI